MSQWPEMRDDCRRSGARLSPRSDGVSMAEIGFVGLGKMGGNMVTRLRRRDHRVVVGDVSVDRAREVAKQTGAVAAASLAELVESLAPPRAVWVMVPAGAPTEQVVREVGKLLA